MKAKDVHTMRDEELKVEGERLRVKLFDLRTQAVTEKVEDTSQFRKIRRDIARLATEQRARRAKAAPGRAVVPAPSPKAAKPVAKASATKSAPAAGEKPKAKRAPAAKK